MVDLHVMLISAIEQSDSVAYIHSFKLWFITGC